MKNQVGKTNKSNYLYIPYNTNLKKKARAMRNNMTAAEKKIWYDCLRGHRHRFLRQKPINNYIVDFYCSKLKLVIEVDGVTHIDKKDIIYDKNRTKFLEDYGLNVLRFWNNEVLEGIDSVYEVVEEKIKKIEKSPQPPLSRGR